MIVVIPTQHILVMEAWDGLLGFIARLPILKLFLGLIISLVKLRKKRLNLEYMFLLHFHN